MKKPNNTKRSANFQKLNPQSTMAIVSLVGLLTGCNKSIAFTGEANAEANPLPTSTPTTLPSPTQALPTSTLPPTSTPWPTPTTWSTPTPLPTATPWPTPAALNPVRLALPTLEPLPVVPTPTLIAAGGLLPVNYAPPNEVDVFGNVTLRWAYSGQLAEDEFFDIKIKPFGSEASVFVDWSKTPEYELRPWSGWSPGLYTWQIGIVKGYKEGETKNFIADTGRDSAKFIIKWQDVGHGGGGNSGGGGASGGRSGGS
ncbi:MAG: hypothetical protein KDJ65_15250 [Anaerolineae bacterium]|nr:hypothetical protein [Anaerolineae bacterium]